MQATIAPTFTQQSHVVIFPVVHLVTNVSTFTHLVSSIQIVPDPIVHSRTQQWLHQGSNVSFLHNLDHCNNRQRQSVNMASNVPISCASSHTSRLSLAVTVLIVCSKPALTPTLMICLERSPLVFLNGALNPSDKIIFER